MPRIICCSSLTAFCTHARPIVFTHTHHSHHPIHPSPQPASLTHSLTHPSTTLPCTQAHTDTPGARAGSGLGACKPAGLRSVTVSSPDSVSLPRTATTTPAGSGGRHNGTTNKARVGACWRALARVSAVAGALLLQLLRATPRTRHEVVHQGCNAPKADSAGLVLQKQSVAVAAVVGSSRRGRHLALGAKSAEGAQVRGEKKWCVRPAAFVLAPSAPAFTQD
jgi:hypothetical protein